MCFCHVTTDIPSLVAAVVSFCYILMLIPTPSWPLLMYFSVLLLCLYFDSSRCRCCYW